MTIKNVELRLNKMDILNIKEICKKMKVKCTGKNKTKLIKELMLPISFKYRMKRKTGPKSWKKSNKTSKTSQKTSPRQPCGICFQQRLHRMLPNIKLGCKHDYHDGCIRPWVVEQGKNTCPLCRAEISDNEQRIIRNFEPKTTRSKLRGLAEESDNDSSSDSDTELIPYGAEWWQHQYETRPEAEVTAEWNRHYGVSTQ